MRRLLLAVMFLVAAAPSWSKEAVTGGVSTADGTGKTHNQLRCPTCQTAAETLPRLLGPPTRDGYKLHLAGKAVADGSCVGAQTVFVCRGCRTYSEDGIHAWQPLPPRFGSQPKTLYVIEYYVSQNLLDEKVTAEEARNYNAQARLKALLTRAGIRFPPGAGGSSFPQPTRGLAVRATAEMHKEIRSYLTREFGEGWKILD